LVAVHLGIMAVALAGDAEGQPGGFGAFLGHLCAGARRLASEWASNAA
jgi:hypothetical protein